MVQCGWRAAAAWRRRELELKWRLVELDFKNHPIFDSELNKGFDVNMHLHM